MFSFRNMFYLRCCIIDCGANLARCSIHELRILHGLLHTHMHYGSIYIAASTPRTHHMGVKAYIWFAVFFYPHQRAFPARRAELLRPLSLSSPSRVDGYTTPKNCTYAVLEHHSAGGFAFAPLSERHLVVWTLRGVVRRLRAKVARPR